MPNIRDRKSMKLLVEKEPAEEGAQCRWCGRSVSAWDQAMEDWGEEGAYTWRICPHCGESQRTLASVTFEGLWLTLALMFVFGFVCWLYQILSQ